jgi:hypothetical protein
VCVYQQGKYCYHKGIKRGKEYKNATQKIPKKYPKTREETLSYFSLDFVYRFFGRFSA